MGQNAAERSMSTDIQKWIENGRRVHNQWTRSLLGQNVLCSTCHGLTLYAQHASNSQPNAQEGSLLVRFAIRN